MKPLVNDIPEAYCSFEVAKLLKAKGFDVFCKDVYTEYLQDTEYYKKGITFEKDSFMKGWNSMEQGNEYWQIYSAPTHAIVVEWLRINFGIHINSSWKVTDESWQYTIYAKPIECNDGFESPQEATDAAIKYAIDKLI